VTLVLPYSQSYGGAVADASERQAARRRLRSVQVRQREIVGAYERAVAAAAAAEREYDTVVERAAQAREAARRRRSLALAGLAAGFRDEETSAEVAGVPVREVRAAMREFDKEAVDGFLAELSASTSGRAGGARGHRTRDEPAPGGPSVVDAG
jgi:hypothetical protein